MLLFVVAFLDIVICNLTSISVKLSFYAQKIVSLTAVIKK